MNTWLHPALACDPVAREEKLQLWRVTDGLNPIDWPPVTDKLAVASGMT